VASIYPIRQLGIIFIQGDV